MQRPFLIVITSRPGSGKTTLAHSLANRIHCPALCQDEFKEGYVHTKGGSHESLAKDVNRCPNETFFETVNLVISKGIRIVLRGGIRPQTAGAKAGSAD